MLTALSNIAFSSKLLFLIYSKKKKTFRGHQYNPYPAETGSD